MGKAYAAQRPRTCVFATPDTLLHLLEAASQASLCVTSVARDADFPLFYLACTGDCCTTLHLEFTEHLQCFKPAVKNEIITSLRESLVAAGLPCTAVLSIDVIASKEHVFFARVTFVAHSHYLRALAAVNAKILSITVSDVNYTPTRGVCCLYILELAQRTFFLVPVDCDFIAWIVNLVIVVIFSALCDCMWRPCNMQRRQDWFDQMRVFAWL